MRISVVSYLNSKPFWQGLRDSALFGIHEFSLDYPHACAEKLLNGQADIGLMPVAMLPKIPGGRIVSNYCIGAVGPVRTVSLFADCPLQEVERIYLDYQSRSSVQLLRFLLKEHWDLKPELLPAYPGYEADIRGRDAGLVIGDRAIPLLERHPFVYDLAEHWLQATGLPFVFAAWVSRQDLEANFEADFNQALAQGLAQAPSIAAFHQADYPSFDLLRYYTEWISYELDEAKRQGLALFLKQL